MKKNFQFTVCTPCYNSAEFIHRVFNSLKNQTYKNFEWIVINDASKDNTHQLINEFLKEVSFPVTYHNLKHNQGVHNNINLAISEAKGDYFVLYGHDDELVPEALNKFNEVLLKYDSPIISAVYALANDENGKLVGKKYQKDVMVSDYWTQFFALNNEGEKFQCFKTVYLKEFYPIDTSKSNQMPSAWLWGLLGTKYKAIFINEILRIYYTNVPTSMTNTMKRDKNPVAIENYYLLWVNKFQYFIKGNYKRRLRGIGGYVSYSLLANRDFHTILSRIDTKGNRVIVSLFYPVAKLYNLIKR